MFFWVTLFLIALIRVSHEIIPHYISGSRITYDIWNVYFGIFILPVLFAFAAAIPFNSEFIQGTRQFLLNRPMATWKIFLVKVSGGLAIMILLTAISYYVFYMPNLDKGRIIGLDRGFFPEVSIYVFLICTTTVYFSILLSSLLFKNSIVSIVLSPFVVVIDFILCLPAIVIFLYFGISPLKCLFVLIPLLMTVVLLIFCYVVWKYSVVRDSGTVKALIVTLAVILAAFYAFHGAITVSSKLRLEKAIAAAEKEGISLSFKKMATNADLDEIIKLADRINEKYLNNIWDFVTSSSDFPYNYKWKDEVDEKKKQEFYRLFTEDKEILEFFRRCRNFVEAEGSKGYAIESRIINPIFEINDFMLFERKFYSAFLDSALCRLRMRSIIKDRFGDNYITPYRSVANAIITIPCEKKYEGIFKQILEEYSSDRLTEKEFINRQTRLYGYFFEKWKEGNYRNRAEEYGFDKLPERFAFGLYISCLGAPLLNRDEAYFINYYAGKLKLCSTPFNKLEQRYIEEDDRRKKDNCLVAGMFIGGYVVYNYNYAKASEGYYTLALALKAYKSKYGEYPESLEKVCPEFLIKLPMDPFSGEGFIYEKKGNGFAVHSVGRVDGKFQYPNLGVSCEQ